MIPLLAIAFACATVPVFFDSGYAPTPQTPEPLRDCSSDASAAGRQIDRRVMKSSVWEQMIRWMCDELGGAR